MISQAEATHEVIAVREFSKIDQAEARFHSDHITLNQILGFTKDINSAFDEPTVMNILWQKLSEVFPLASNCSLLKKVGDEEKYRPSHWVWLLGDESGDPPKISQTIIRKAIENGESLLFQNARQEFEPAESIDDAELISGMCVPLWGKQDLIGVLQVDSRAERGMFTAIDLDLLTIFGCQLTTALEKIALYEQVKNSELSLRNENRRLKRNFYGSHQFKNIIGTSKAMQEVFSLMDQVLETSITVLIQGETGTGKELIARALHHNGARRDKPFLVQNCGAFPEPLIESELFGHRKGAFTGASEDRKGLFEEADGGTVFLDEIGEMPKEMQVRLLRVLQDGEIKRVGETKSRHVDVRIIAATNRDLQEDVKSGRFREDLYYRLNVILIDIPPLRNRREDIPLLTVHLLEKFSSEQKKSIPGLSEEAMHYLKSYSFPGNVRQLENIMNRAVSLHPGPGPIEPKHLDPIVTEKDNVMTYIDRGTQSMAEALDEVKRRWIQQAFDTAGSMSGAARELGISRPSLYKMMKRLGMRI